MRSEKYLTSRRIGGDQLSLENRVFNYDYLNRMEGGSGGARVINFRDKR